MPLGLQIPSDHPDRKKYYSLNFRQREFDSSDVAEITLMSPGDILVLYTDGVYDGSDEEARELLEAVMREHYRDSARNICNALLELAVSKTTVFGKTATKHHRRQDRGHRQTNLIGSISSLPSAAPIPKSYCARSLWNCILS